MNRPYGWDGPNPYAPHDRAEQERIDEWEAAVQAEARAVIAANLASDDYTRRIRRAARELLAKFDEQEERP